MGPPPLSPHNPRRRLMLHNAPRSPPNGVFLRPGFSPPRPRLFCRIVKRFPGLKLVLEALIGSVQGVFNVAAVCFLFYIIFAILCVNYFKGLLMSCQGNAFDALPGEVVSFLEDPLPWSEMSSGQREWFGPLSNVSEAFSGDGFSSSIGGNLSTSGVEYCDVITGGLWPDAAGCCSAWPTSAEEAPTSYEVPVL